MGYLDNEGLAHFWEKIKGYVDARPTAGALVNAPLGAIVIWSGTLEDIPDGWSPCNGENGTVNLEDKFVLGAGETRKSGETGGEETVALTVDEIPNHSHSVTVYEELTGSPISANSYGKTSQAAVKTTLTTTKIGGSKAHNNMPPYYALLYIQKTSASSEDFVTREEMTAAITGAMEASY